MPYIQYVFQFALPILTSRMKGLVCLVRATHILYIGGPGNSNADCICDEGFQGSPGGPCSGME